MGDMSDTPERYDQTRPCPKCGSGPTPSEFCGRQGPAIDVFSKHSQHPYVPEGGHLHRKCLHCGYERIELALDAEVMTEPERAAAIHDARAAHLLALERFRADMNSAITGRKAKT